VTTTRMSRHGPGRSPLITRAAVKIPDEEVEA
jgi:hypothetical protein